MEFPFSKPRPKTLTLTLTPPPPIAALHHHFTSILTNLTASFATFTNQTLPASIHTLANQTLPASIHTLTNQTLPAIHHHLFPLSKHSTQHRSKMSMDSISERLAGVPVYALANADEEFVLVSGTGVKRDKGSLGLLCFKREDAEALLGKVKALDTGMKEGSKVVELALNKVFDLKVDGVAFRFIPDPCQVANAIKEKEKEKVGKPIRDFSGVPVFQSKSLVLRSMDKRYHPVFFRKEDLLESLRRASRLQRKLNPAIRGDIEVGVLEEIIEAMKGSAVSEWDDVVFIPPGVDVPAGISEERHTRHA